MPWFWDSEKPRLLCPRRTDSALGSSGKGWGTTDRAGEELTLTRDGVAKTVDIGALERFGLQNEPVEPGDVIFVPEGERRVLILGEVRSPGYHQFRPGDRVLDVIGLAGGLTTNALQEQVSLSRPTPEGTDIFMIDFSGLMDNRYLADNLHVQGGDVIIVPAEDRGVIVLGEVQRPGYYTYRSGDGLLDAIMLAGGFTQNANEERVSLTRQTGARPKLKVLISVCLWRMAFWPRTSPCRAAISSWCPAVNGTSWFWGKYAIPVTIPLPKDRALWS